jgi:preprotein translocase subunit SecE
MENASGVEQPKRYVAIFYVLAAIALAKFFEKISALVFSYVRFNDATILVEGWTLSTLIGFVLAAALAVVVWRIPRTQAVSMEIALELKRVTWPSMRETRASTVAVVVASFIAAIVLGVFDFIWGRLSAMIY